MAPCPYGCGRTHRVAPSKSNCTKYPHTSVTTGHAEVSSSLRTKSVLNKQRKRKSLAPIDSINPTGTVYTEYNPSARAAAPLASNLATYAETAEISPDEKITVYRGHPKGAQDKLNPGDFITTNRQLAQDYAGTGTVTEQTVRADEIIDDKDDPLGEEYLYRPKR